MSKRNTPNVNNQAFFNILSTVILSGINFFTIPLFTRLLGAENYGLYSVFHSWVVILMCVMGLETRAAGGTALYRFPNEYKGYMASALFLGTLCSAVFIVAGIIFRDFLGQILGFPAWIAVILLLCAFGHYVVEFARSMFTYTKKAHMNFLVSVSLSVITILLSLLLVYVMNKKGQEALYQAQVYGVTVPYLVVAAILWIYIFSRKPVLYKKEYWGYCLQMGLPIVFHVLANDLLKQSNKLMLGYLGYAGVTVGIYSFLCTFTGILNTILSALNTSWCPFYYDDLNENASERLAVKSKNYLELFAVLACGFLLVGREFCYVFASEEYWPGIDVVPILVLGVYFVFMYQFCVNFEFYNRKTKVVAVGTVSAALGNILLNLLLIPKLGMYGAAIATALSYGLLFVAHFIIAKNLKEMKFHMKLKDFVPGLTAVVACMGLFYLLSGAWYIRWLLGVALGIYLVIKVARRKTIF